MSGSNKPNMCRSEKPNTGQVSDNRVNSKRRNMPPILRLDSTGEITSHRFGGDSGRVCSRRCEMSTNMNKKLQNLVTYVGGAASSFIELGSGISNHLTGEKASPFDCVRKMLKAGEDSFNGNKCSGRMADMTETVSQPQIWGKPHGGAGNGRESYPYITKQLSSWSNSVFGVFNRSQNEMLHCPHSFKKQAYSCDNYGYSPFHRQGYYQNKKRNNHPYKTTDKTVNPDLKPYNSRLLENSKQRKKDCSATQQPSPNQVHKNTVEQESKNSFSGSDMTNKELKTDNARNASADENHHNKTVTDCPKFTASAEGISLEQSNSPRASKSSMKTVKIEDSSHTSDSSAKGPAEKVIDWFEYENKDLKTIPVDLKHVAEKNASINSCHNVTESESSSVHQSLHSWLSVDLDSNSVNCISEELTKGQTDTSQGDKQEIAKEIQKTDAESEDDKVNNNSCDIQKINVKIQNITLSPKSKPDANDNMFKLPDDKSFILYVRKVPSAKKSSKPSCKKRRRQKAKKEKTTEEIHENDPPLKKAEASQDCRENPIAFILGIDSGSDSARNTQPFLVPCDINSDSDWSDSDLDCDDSAEDNMPDDLSMFSLCDNFNPLNFKVTCSVQSSPIEMSSPLDSINLSWQVNISLDTDAKKKKACDKKVHFASEEALVDIQPIAINTDWVEAYQEARKGPWEQYALDRGRFKKRITDSETILNPILLDSHRQNIYRERFVEN